MKEAAPASLKKPALLALLSALSCVAIVFAWLKFPSLVPLAVLIILGPVTAVTAIVAEIIVLLRLARTARLGRQPLTGIRNLSKRAAIGFILVFVLGNAVLLSVIRVSVWYIVAANLAFVLSWFSVRLLAARRFDGKSRKKD